MSFLSEIRLACVLSAWTGEVGHCQWCNKALTQKGRRRAFCSSQCYRVFDKNHDWTLARRNARKRAGHKCVREGCTDDTDYIEVNHIIPLVGQGYGPSCFHHEGNLEAICKPHHQIETNRQRDERKLATTKEEDILVLVALVATLDEVNIFREPLGSVPLQPEEVTASLLGIHDSMVTLEKRGPKRPF